MPDYNLIVSSPDETAPLQAPIPNTASASPIKTTPASGRTLSQGLTKRLGENSIERFVVSPLNSATGGLASPVYHIGKALVTDKSSAMIGVSIAGLAMAGVMFAINAIETRIAKMEAKAEEMNNKDNALIRAGSKGTATYYTGGLSGVKSTNRN